MKYALSLITTMILSQSQPVTANEYNSLACHESDVAGNYIQLALSASEDVLEAEAERLIDQDQCIEMQWRAAPEQVPPVIDQVEGWFGLLKIVQLPGADTDVLYFILPVWKDSHQLLIR